MLSICIPVYNFDIRPLIRQLHSQLDGLSINYELLLIDDVSFPEFKKVNREVSQFPFIRYIEANTKLGRSKIRNCLAKEARYPFLLFLDCDSYIPDKNFIRHYLEILNIETVVCGGRNYPPQISGPNHILRWLYGRKRECFNADQRNMRPSHSFFSNNFLIPKALFEKATFNEQLNGYGHEDTLFGLELAKAGIKIIHIDNPLTHIGLETAREFLEKTGQGLENLYQITRKHQNNPELIANIKILKYYYLLHWIRGIKAMGNIYNLLRNRLLKNLTGDHPSLLCFDLYKLGYYCQLNLKHKSEAVNEASES